MARTYDKHADNRRRDRVQPETTMPLVTEALAHMSAWRVYLRQREYGEDNANAAMAAEYNRIIAHVGEPVDVLFGGA